MLSIILGILKVIGIILLVVLGLVLLVVTIVLFVPIRYTGSGVITQEKKDAHIKVTWLLHAIRVKIDYTYPDKQPQISVKALWMDVLKLLEKKKNVSLEKTDEALDSEKVQEEKESTEVVEATEVEDTSEEKETIEEKEATEETEESPKETLREKIDKIVFKITSVYDKIKHILGNIKYYWDILNEEDTKGLIAHAFEVLLKIFKSIRPRKLKVNAEFGFDTPDTTGQMYGLYWTLKPALGEHVELTPNFDEKILVGDLYFKGRITLFVILLNGLRILFDRRLKPLIDKLKNGGKQNG